MGVLGAALAVFVEVPAVAVLGAPWPPVAPRLGIEGSRPATWPPSALDPGGEVLGRAQSRRRGPGPCSIPAARSWAVLNPGGEVLGRAQSRRRGPGPCSIPAARSWAVLDP